MFFIAGFLIGCAIFVGLLYLVDYIGYRRGLGGADPLSPIMAYTALLGAIILLALVVVGGSIDAQTERSSHAAPKENSNG